MRIAMIFCALLALLALAGCGDEAQEWKDAEVGAKEFFVTLTKSEFAKAYQLHDEKTILRSSITEAEFVKRAKETSAKYPRLLDYVVLLEPQLETSTRAGLYEFKARLTWSGEWPLKGVDDSETPFLAEEMRITMRKRGDKFTVHVVRPWSHLSTDLKKSKSAD